LLGGKTLAELQGKPGSEAEIEQANVARRRAMGGREAFEEELKEPEQIKKAVETQMHNIVLAIAEPLSQIKSEFELKLLQGVLMQQPSGSARR
jgi:hypothetical protein